MRRVRTLALTALAAMLLAAGPCAGGAQAQSSGAVVLVRVAGDERIALRLRAELRSQGWRVFDVSPRGDAASRPLDAWAGHRGADAVLRAVPRQLAIELWVERAGDQSGNVELITATGLTADASVLALRVAEALRARGLGPARSDTPSAGTQPTGSAQTTPVRPDDIKKPATGAVAPLSTAAPTTTDVEPARSNAAGTDNAATNSEAAPPNAATPATAPPVNNEASASKEPEASVTAPTPAADSGKTPLANAEPEPEDENEPETTAEPTSPPLDDALFYLELAPALTWSPGGFPLHLDAWGDLRLQLLDAVSVSVFGAPSVLAGRVRSDGGASALVNTLAVGGAVDLRAATGAWELSAGLGAAALFTWLGDPKSSNLDGHKTSIRTPAAVLRMAATTRLGGSTQVFLRALIGYALPEPHWIHFPLEPRKYWGEPFVTLALGLRFALPGRR